MDNFPSPSDDLDNAKLVTVADCADEPSAALRVHVLADAGIRAVAVGGLTAGMRAEVPTGVQVKVIENDAQAAKQVLSELKRVDPETDAASFDEPGFDDAGFDDSDSV